MLGLAFNSKGLTVFYPAYLGVRAPWKYIYLIGKSKGLLRDITLRLVLCDLLVWSSCMTLEKSSISLYVIIDYVLFIVDGCLLFNYPLLPVFTVLKPILFVNESLINLVNNNVSLIMPPPYSLFVVVLF